MQTDTHPSRSNAGFLLFTLARPLQLTNPLLRTHWGNRRRAQRELAREIMALTASRRPSSPWYRVRVTIHRYSTGEPDADASCAKHLLDVLQPLSTKHPFGLGIITEDDRAHLVLVQNFIKTSKRVEQRTVVCVEELT